jgi:hypothetical protein
MGRSGLLSVVFAGVVLGALGCQAIQLPTGASPEAKPTPALSPLSVPVLGATPTPSPTARPTPTPSASPTPTPTATPTPTPTPAGSCALSPSNPTNPWCPDGATSLLFESVDQALTRVTETHPQLFDFNSKNCPNCYRVLNVPGYISAVLSQLGTMGLCAVGDAEEIGVKESNDYSEQFDILVSSGHMRRGPGSYRGTCRPAIF